MRLAAPHERAPAPLRYFKRPEPAERVWRMRRLFLAPDDGTWWGGKCLPQDCDALRPFKGEGTWSGSLLSGVCVRLCCEEVPSRSGAGRFAEAFGTNSHPRRVAVAGAEPLTTALWHPNGLAPAADLPTGFSLADAGAVIHTTNGAQNACSASCSLSTLLAAH